MLELTKGKDDLGFIISVTYGFLFVFKPIFTALLMRFSPIKWVIDPFAALEIPLFLYAAMILQNMKRRNMSLISSFLAVNNELNDDGKTGWLFLIYIFIFGIVSSISCSRVKGNSAFYKLTDKISDHSSSAK